MQRLERLRTNIERVYLGNPAAIDRIIVCLLARGHVLIEDLPGVGKTILATALARSLDATFSRVQLTPDMLPGDVLGVTVWDQKANEFIFKPGPIFANIVLADEINRTTPRTQSALLEAMNEAQVSIDGQTRKLIQPFIVIATQNPLEFEGTYFLPENQLDRFLMRVRLGYPGPEAEAKVLELNPARNVLHELEPVMTASDLVELQKQVTQVKVDPALTQYIVTLANATREHESLVMGISTRGALALMQTARATAMLKRRDYVVPDDILENVISVCAHRVIGSNYQSEGHSESNARIIQQIVETLPAPM